MKEMKRVLSLVLCIVMLVGLMPISVFAVEGEPEAQTAGPLAVVVAASDFQQRDGHAKSDEVMEGIIAAMVAGGVTDVDGAIFCGDYSNSNTAAESNTGLSYVYGNYNTTWGLGYEDIIFVQGNHDPASTTYLDDSGANDPESGDYGVFVINEDDFEWGGGDASSVKTTAANLKSYLDQKVADEFDAPIFVASHVPLHYSMRTYRDGDSRYAKYLFDVLNEGAENGLNIIFLYGHNHSQSFDNYHGGGAVFYSDGDEILISDVSDNTKHTTETIHFTYMNAGFTGRFDSTDTADPTNTGSVFEIYEDKVVISRYDANGLHRLKSAGQQSGSYSEEADLYAPNTRVEESPQEMELSLFAEPVTLTHEPTGVSVTAVGLTGLNVTKTDKTVEGYSAYVTYDIQPEGYTQGKTATVTIEVPEEFDPGKSVIVFDADQKIADTVIKNNCVSFRTTHFSEYSIAQLDGSGVTAEGFLSTDKVWRVIDSYSFVNGETYLLISNRCGGATSYPFMAMTLNGTDVKPTDVTAVIKEDAEGSYIDPANVTNAMKWVASSMSNGRVKLANGSNYLLGSSNTENTAITTTTNASANYIRWGVTDLYGYHVLTSYYQTTADNTPRYARYSNGKGYFVQRETYDISHVEPWHLVASEDTTKAVTLSVEPGIMDLATGTAEYLTSSVLVNGAAADSSAITWSSSNTAVATVDESGKVTGIADGEATITATLTKANGQDVYGTVSVEIPVKVTAKKVVSVTVDPMNGSVPRNAKADAETGSVLTITYDDGSIKEIPVTLGMLSGDNLNLKVTGTCTGLTVTYGDYTVEGYTLEVLNALGNNYPEYPNEGAVKVNKTGTGIDFQSSGIAQVEISASGVPRKKGADVIVMLDTSSSMKQPMTTDDTQTRLEALKNSLNVLIQQLQKKNADGSNPDIRVAVTDFNGYNMTGAQNSAYYRNHTVDKIGANTTGSAAINAHIFTNVNGTDQANKVASAATLNETAFQDINTIDLVNNNPFDNEIQLRSGTNYDYAFDAIYQLGESIQAANAEAGVERDLYVIFMSDGGPFQYNYFSGNSSNYNETDGNWNDWLNGTYAGAANVPGSGVHKYFYNGPGNTHRMADAIKGDPSKMYDVIRKDADPDTFVDVTGDGVADDYMIQLPGLGATMYSIGFCIVDDNDLTKETIDQVLVKIATDPDKHYYSVDNGESLDGAFETIGSEINYAAYNARFVDQMGDDYNLHMKTSTYEVVENGETVEKTLAPKIEIITYDIWTRQEWLDGKCAESQVGDRKGTFKVLETVTFNADGTEAYSDQIDGGKTNILADGTKEGYVKGVIYAKNFLYNTNFTDTAVEGVSIPTGTNADGTTTGSSNVLPAETFYWKMGTVQTSELAMRYYVYLTGSMEGTREGGSYPTNEYATLYYDNYLENPCKKDTVSPVMPWKEANVSYAFYLVNEDGQIIVNQTTGQTGSFANKIAVTNPVVYETVLLNSDEEVSSIDIASLGVLPEGYTLYDFDGNETGATYTVNINSNTTGSWEITTVKDVATTYVTQYDPTNAAAYSNELTNSTIGDDYTHTVVWFAVLWKVQALPDTVVIDYGLPVDISVLANDMFGENGKLAGVGAYSDSLNLEGHDPAMASGFGTSYTGTYGAAKADSTTGKVRYTLNTMEMNGYEKFAYAVNYTGNENAGYYYDTVTVIPATTIYYEDDFLTYAKYDAGGTPSGTWDTEGSVDENATQAEDRPGKYSLTDANNIYGYDDVNKGMSTFSQGAARKVHVDANSYATASFTFWGTGFDVISMTSNTTGVIAVKVTTKRQITIGEKTYDAGAAVVNNIVNTYYGYDYDEENQEWVAVPDTENSLYQVPVLQIEDLPYGQYDVLITATYMSAMDKTTADGYDLYLDAVRIYDPANDGASDGTVDTTIEDAYKADGEGWPSYIELRNKLIEKETLGNSDTDTKVEGLVFIDGNPEVGDAKISDYISYGPNNEVYLAPGQRVAFLLSTPDNIANVHIGIKSADGQTATYTITNIAKADNLETGVKAGDYYAANTFNISTATDMYYDITGYKGDIIVISNTGDRYDTPGIISITNIKSTYTSDPNAAVTTGDNGDDSIGGEASESTGVSAVAETEQNVGFETYVYMTPEAANLTLRSLNGAAEEEKPEDNVPETTVPEETEPETSVPEETEPETTEPEETEPEIFEPDRIKVKVDRFWIKVGQKIKVTVTTSSDVDYVMINGVAVANFKKGFRDSRIWNLTITCSKAGTMEISVVCYNEDDVASEAVTEHVTVRDNGKKNSKGGRR